MASSPRDLPLIPGNILKIASNNRLVFLSIKNEPNTRCFCARALETLSSLTVSGSSSVVTSQNLAVEVREEKVEGEVEVAFRKLW